MYRTSLWSGIKMDQLQRRLLPMYSCFWFWRGLPLSFTNCTRGTVKLSLNLRWSRPNTTKLLSRIIHTPNRTSIMYLKHSPKLTKTSTHINKSTSHNPHNPNQLNDFFMSLFFHFTFKKTFPFNYKTKYIYWLGDRQLNKSTKQKSKNPNSIQTLLDFEWLSCGAYLKVCSDWVGTHLVEYWLDVKLGEFLTGSGRNSVNSLAIGCWHVFELAVNKF